jgi:hypothetical protein
MRSRDDLKRVTLETINKKLDKIMQALRIF